MEEKIKALIKNYISGPYQKYFELDLRKVAEEMQILPLMVDSGGCFALSTTGEIVSFGECNYRDLRIESDPKTIRTALYQGSLWFSEIKEMIPARPEEAIDCKDCETFNKKHNNFSDSFVCMCGGLGWLLPEEI